MDIKKKWFIIMVILVGFCCGLFIWSHSFHSFQQMNLENLGKEKKESPKVPNCIKQVALEQHTLDEKLKLKIGFGFLITNSFCPLWFKKI